MEKQRGIKITNIDKTKQCTIQSVVVSYLEKPKHRANIIIPQMITWVITAFSLYMHHCFGFSLLPFTIPIHLISAGLLIVALIVILWTDFKR